MRKLTILLLSIVLTTACNETKEKRETMDFNIEIKTEKVADQKIKTEIKTNFPDNTPFTITASRDYKRENNPEQYAGELYYSYNSFVKNGSIEFTFDTDDQKWMNDYKEIQKQNGEFDKTLTDIDLATIKDSIEISVLYTPKAEQSKGIKDLIGENGENLKGIGTENNGSFKTFSKTIKIHDKF